MIRHLLQIFFTLGLTFMVDLLHDALRRLLHHRSYQPCNNNVASQVILGRYVDPDRPVRVHRRLLVAIDDPAATQVIRTQLDDHAIAWQYPDVVHPHLAADVSQNLVPVVELHPEERVGQGLNYRALNLDGTVFLGHVLRDSLVVGRSELSFVLLSR